MDCALSGVGSGPRWLAQLTFTDTRGDFLFSLAAFTAAHCMNAGNPAELNAKIQAAALGEEYIALETAGASDGTRLHGGPATGNPRLESGPPLVSGGSLSGMTHPALGAYYGTVYNQAIGPDPLGRWYQDEALWAPVRACPGCRGGAGSVDGGQVALYVGGVALLGLLAVMMFSGGPSGRRA